MRTEFEPEGDLPSVDILAGFVKLWRESASGVLRAEQAASSARFDLADGDIVGVTSSDPRFDTAAILVRAGKLDATALDRLVAPEGSDRALAALAAGILTKREWRWGEKIRAIEVLSDLLMWTGGSYTFDASARPQAQDLRLPIPRLVLELFLRSRDRNLIDHQLGPADARLVRSESFEQEFSGFGLTADAESVVRLIDGHASAAEISEKAPAEEFAVQKLLAALVTLGLVRPEFAPEEPVARENEGWGRSELLASGPLGPSSRVNEIEQWPEPDETPSSVREEMEASGARDPSIPADGEEPPPLEEEYDAPSASLRDSAIGGWEPMPPEPLDRTLEMPLGPDAPSRSGGRGGLLAWLAGLIVVGAVVAFFLLRPFDPRGPSPVPSPTPMAAMSQEPTPQPAFGTGVVPQTSPEPRLSPVPPSPSPRASRPTRVPARPTPATSPPAAEGERRTWLERAERDRRKLQSEPGTAYAVQLELACEVPTLEKAWAYDRPAGTLWLLSTPHGDRTCFKVLWGRYGSLEAARRAKSGIPSFFTTGGNRPAVVAVR